MILLALPTGDGSIVGASQSSADLSSRRCFPLPASFLESIIIEDLSPMKAGSLDLSPSWPVFVQLTDFAPRRAVDM